MIDDGCLEILPVVSNAGELSYAGFELYFSRSSAFLELLILVQGGIRTIFSPYFSSIVAYLIDCCTNPKNRSDTDTEFKMTVLLNLLP